MRRVFVLLCLFVLSACGGGGTDGSGPTPTGLAFPLPNVKCPDCLYGTGGERHYGTSRVPHSMADVRQMPVYHSGQRLHVGVDQGRQTGRLPSTGQRRGTTVRQGRLVDGVGEGAVRRYLLDGVGEVARRYTGAPEVRVIGPSSAEEANRVAHAVRLVNAALPATAKMRMGAALPGFSLRDTVDNRALYYRSGRERANTIHVEFVPDYRGPEAGGRTWNNFAGARVESTYIQMYRPAPAVSDADSRRTVILIAHEILHALGYDGGDGHVSPSFDTIMEGTADIYALNQSSQQPRSLLYPVDREALRALYGRLEPGDDAAAFGPWASASTHVVGNGAHAHFGVALRNGYAEPYAYGQIPGQDLANNRALSGTVTWEGTLLGFTPSARPVAGDAGIGVNLTTLTGRADFTALEQWAAGAAPGDVGTGTMWGDGDLGYSIAVRGNTFRQTGGDTGTLTGVFTGRSHEGAAGTLERSDLTAAFGASR